MNAMTRFAMEAVLVAAVAAGTLAAFTLHNRPEPVQPTPLALFAVALMFAGMLWVFLISPSKALGPTTPLRRRLGPPIMVVVLLLVGLQGFWLFAG